MLKTFINAFLVVLGFGLSSCNSQSSETIIVVNEDEFNTILAENDDAQLIDVRTVKEFNDGFINNAENIVYDANFKNKLQGLDKTKPVVLYCKRGGRSAKASKILEAEGFKIIYDLDGGYDMYTKKAQ
jgi:rhodanese-related sulfurtransferase